MKVIELTLEEYNAIIESREMSGKIKGVTVKLDDCKEDEKVNFKSDLKLLNSNYNEILKEVAEHHMDYAQTAYSHTKNNDNYVKYNKMVTKYTENLNNNIKALKLISARYFGKCQFELVYDSELIEKDNHLCFVECGIPKNGKDFKVFHCTFEG